MSNVLLVGIDGSEPGERAAEFAANVARAQDASLLIAYVIEVVSLFIQHTRRK